MNRRQFVAQGSLAAALALAKPTLAAEEEVPSDGAAPNFTSDDAALMRVYNAALSTLSGNMVQFPVYPGPVLVEGSVYHGVWLECAPQEAKVYGAVGPETAHVISRNNHLIFFALQKEDGQIPCSIKPNGPAFGQIQMVVPIAATAWELARQTGDSELLDKAYNSCVRWDAWLRRFRNTRGTGLCEGFCTYDTGQDNSPRWKGMPNRCPDGDARKCPQAEGLPRLCPDLSATVYGGRVALAAMAKALNKTGEADRWIEDAETIRRLILDRLYDPQDAAFYDLDAQNRFVRIRSSTILNVLGEHVPDADLFEAIWQKQVHNPKAFWAPYPFPSVALDDPQFVRPIPRNSWGGASQALTALRSPRWMEHYGKSAELAWMMQRWVEALMQARGEFRQQMDPLDRRLYAGRSGRIFSGGAGVPGFLVETVGGSRAGRAGGVERSAAREAGALRAASGGGDDGTRLRRGTCGVADCGAATCAGFRSGAVADFEDGRVGYRDWRCRQRATGNGGCDWEANAGL